MRVLLLSTPYPLEENPIPPLSLTYPSPHLKALLSTLPDKTKNAATNTEIIIFIMTISSSDLRLHGHLRMALFFRERSRIVLRAHSCLWFGFRESELIMRQLFLLVLAVNVEISCLTFLLAHFGHAALAFSCSLKLCINENFFLQASQRYSYVGMFFPPYQDY